MNVEHALLKFAERLADRFTDELYLRIRFRRRFGWWPRVKKPQTFNEHLLQYKLSSKSDSRLPALADKLRAKVEVAAKIGERYIIPTIWSGSQLPERSERNWPKPYVLKATHQSGTNIFVQDGETEDWESIEATCADWLNTSFGRRGREWHYAQIKPMLIVEPRIGDPAALPNDIKIFCFHGKAQVINIIQDRFEQAKGYSFDLNWNLLPFDFIKRRGTEIPKRPANLDEMVRLAETLARDFTYVSVDLYNVAGRIYFGELTFTTSDGMGRFYPPSGDLTLGSLWTASACGAARHPLHRQVDAPLSFIHRFLQQRKGARS